MNKAKMVNSKVSSLGSPSISSNLMSRIAMNQANGSSGSKKLRTELRRVMSDRVLKITKFSQLQNVDKIKQKNELNNSKNQNAEFGENTSIQNNEHSNSMPNFNLTTKQINPEQKNENSSNNIVENTDDSLILPTFNDKNELIDFVKKTYDQLVEKNVNLGQTVNEISKAIKAYSKEHNLDSQNTISEILKDSLIQTPLQLKQRYKSNENSENLKTEAQIQILLSLEEYINANTALNKIPLDEDFVWEIANSIRWISQIFKEKFKIEKFIFGEVYPSYFGQAPEIILSLMEELGYDKEDNLDESCNSSNPASASNSLHISPNKSPSVLSKNDNNYSQFTDVFSKNEQANTTPAASSKLNALFEDIYAKNEMEPNENDDQLQSQKNEDKDNDSDDLLNDFKKKKTINRFSSFNGNSTTGRSIVIQTKKRMKLKIRSPCKDPSSSVNTNISSENSKKSPGTKIQNLLIDDDNGKKRPRTYLITDTPDHKQKTTIIRTKQEKIRKRFSFQPLNNNTNPNNNSLPIIPDTPVKNDNRFINGSEPAPTIGIISSRGSDFFKSKIFSSPSKILSPKKS